MEPSVAKRPRIEHRNAEEIIEDQKLVIENLTARIQQLEEKVKFLESSSTETKIMTIPIPELPNETWLQIMSYLSTFDVLKMWLKFPNGSINFLKIPLSSEKLKWILHNLGRKIWKKSTVMNF